MCGIAGILRSPEVTIDGSVLTKMTELVAHRGPDGSGLTFLSLHDTRETHPNGGWQVGLGHRRLSILDLSEAGRQPMCYRERYWLTYNGEVYNFVELREELLGLGHRFRSRSDTEVILAAYAEWGVGAFSRMRGMWGLLLVDLVERQAILCRDRLGIKPLYFARRPNALFVASEIKQLTVAPGLALHADDDALLDYLSTGYEDTRRTFFREVETLPPGCFMRVELDDLKAGPAVSFWHPERIEPSIDDAEVAARVFAGELRESVRLHLRSDVPVGAALSGGLDSSAIALLVHDLEPGADAPLHTFTATFPGDPSDERAFVDRVLDPIAATPHFVTPEPERMLEELDRFAWIHDEPVGSASQYAGWCIARITREAGVPVTLNGQGGDEVLGGYWQSYLMRLRQLLRDRRPLALLWHLAGSLTPHGNPELLRQLPIMGRRYLERRKAAPGAKEKVERLMSMSDSERRVYEIRELFLPRLLKWDDRNFMAFSVEGRYPFLDHRLIDIALSFRPSVLYSRGWTKVPLRQGLENLMPEAIARRRTKLGFETPQQRWLRGALKPSVEGWLSGDSPLWSRIDRKQMAALGNGHSSEEAGQALFRGFLADRWMRVFSL